MGRRQLIAGNWKMYKGGSAGVELAQAVAEGAKALEGVEVAICAPFTALAAVAATLSTVAGNIVEVGAQNFYPKDEGAFTGEISAPMLLEAGAKWVLVGHSERRQFFGETDATVAEKTKVALAKGLRPIVCIGELLEERESGKTLDVVARQLDAVIELLAEKPGVGVIAYEPVWAIGTGKVAGPEQAQEVHAAIRQRLAARSPELAAVTKVLYGGSVKADNAAALLGCEDVDGALVGGASLTADSFVKIAAAAPKG